MGGGAARTRPQKKQLGQIRNWNSYTKSSMVSWNGKGRGKKKDQTQEGLKMGGIGTFFTTGEKKVAGWPE